MELKPDEIPLVEGHFIRLSKVLEEYKKNENEAKVFNVNASRARQCGSPSINLNGENGNSKSTPGESGKGENRGEDGVPGGSGRPAGYFIVVADYVYNSKQLPILANGRNGGNGQAGGKGGNGQARGKGGNGQAGGKGGNGTKEIDAPLPSDKRQKTPYGVVSQEWKQLSQVKDGKNGVDGGIGGSGANSGFVNLSTFAGISVGWPTVQNFDSEIGAYVAGDLGRNKAKHGNKMKAYYWNMRSAGADIDAEWSPSQCYNTGHSSYGSNGIAGGNIKEREPKIDQQPASITNTFLIDVKRYILTMAAKTPLLRHSLDQLLQNIDKTRSIRKLYSISDFLYEMNILESVFNNIYNHINLASYYVSLLNRIREYADGHKNQITQAENR